MHGNHVIQKCIEQMPPDSVVFIIESVQDKTEAMAVHSYGCRVIQRLLEHCDAQKLHGLLEMILQESTIRKLAMDLASVHVLLELLDASSSGSGTSKSSRDSSSSSSSHSLRKFLDNFR